MMIVFLVAPVAHGAFRSDNFVRSASQYLVAGSDLKQSDFPTLSKFDLVVLPAEAQLFNPTAAQQLRALNPDIILLAYVPTVSYNDRYWSDALHKKLKARLTRDMELWDDRRNQRSIWPSTSAYNVANAAYRNAWLDYVARDVWPSGYWDGIFFDEVGSDISWIGAVDFNHDGRAESAADVDRAWKAGYVDLFSRARSALGRNAILISNGSSEATFQPFVNGRMFESFPTPWEGSGKWQDSMQRLVSNSAATPDPDVYFLNSNTNNTGTIDYRRMRFGLSSALVGGAFYGYAHGEQDYQKLWTFDEYNAFLGRAVDGPKDMLNGRNTVLTPSVWSREFQAGRAIVNATDQPRTVQLGNEFEKINGAQDRLVNDGRIVSQVTLAPQDGIVLLRPIEELVAQAFRNGSFVRIFDRNGTRKRTGFFAYTGATVGGDTVVRYDLDGNGTLEMITANASTVRIHAPNGAIRSTFQPYGAAYNKGINLAVGDLENDGRVEIVTGTKNGGGPQVRIFNKDGKLIHPGFFAFHPDFRGGVNVTLGNVTGDAADEIIVGAGVGGGPQVQIYNKDGRLLAPGFFAYDYRVRSGVTVAAGDVTGDGRTDIITGTGSGSAPLVRVFSANGAQQTREFYAFDAAQKTGVPVAASDLDGDGVAEIIALTTDVFTQY